MSKKRLVIIGLLAMITTFVALNAKNASSAKPAANSLAANPTTQPANTSVPLQTNEIPVHVVYGVLFGELLAFKREALAREARGTTSPHLRNYAQRHLGLNSQQAEMLQSVAEQYTQELVPIDTEARRIIGAARARYPHGELPVGDTPPLAPGRLKSLEESRTTLLLRAREQIRTALGDDIFQQFDGVVRQDIAKQMQTIALPKPRR